MDLNEIGSYDLLLPVPSREPEVLHVEVALAPSSDMSCYISIIVWHIDFEKTSISPAKITNNSGTPIIVRQHGQKFDKSSAILSQTVNASSEIALGWPDPASANKIEIHVDSHQSGVSSVIIDMTDVGTTKSLCLGEGRTLYFYLLNYKYGKVLDVHEASKDLAVSVHQVSDTFSIALGMRKLSISVIAEKPIRREILAMQLQNLTLDCTFKGCSISYVMKLEDVQVDNYLEFNEYPVLLSDDRREESANMPLLEAFIEAETVSDQTVYRSLLARLLEVKVNIDASSLQLFVLDFYLDTLPDWTGMMSTKVTDCKAYRVALTHYEFNAEELSNKAKFKEKIYIENLVIHPLKVSLSFTSTPVQRRFDGGILDAHWLKIIRSVGVITTFSDVPIRISSFIACNVLESPEDLASIIILKFSRDVQGQLLHLIGSVFGRLDVIGRPADLFSHIGGGVSDFFYEPYQGNLTTSTA